MLLTSAFGGGFLLSQEETVPFGALDEVLLLGLVWQVVGDSHRGENGHPATRVGLLTLAVNHQDCHVIATFLHLKVWGERSNITITQIYLYTMD